MNTSEDREARYRRRADEAYIKADGLTDCETRKVMLEVAATWRRLADYEEKKFPFGTNQPAS